MSFKVQRFPLYTTGLRDIIEDFYETQNVRIPRNHENGKISTQLLLQQTRAKNNQ